MASFFRKSWPPFLITRGLLFVARIQSLYCIRQARRDVGTKRMQLNSEKNAAALRIQAIHRGRNARVQVAGERVASGTL